MRVAIEMDISLLVAVEYDDIPTVPVVVNDCVSVVSIEIIVGVVSLLTLETNSLLDGVVLSVASLADVCWVFVNDDIASSPSLGETPGAIVVL